MGTRLIATLAAALCLPLVATADVSYTYTGNLFTSAQAKVLWDYVPPETNDALSAAAQAALLQDRASFTFSLPVYIPQGWSAFSTKAGYGGALAAPLQALRDGGYPDPGVTWRGDSSKVADQGNIPLTPHDDSTPQYLPPDLSVSLHVGQNHQIDAWEIVLKPGYYYSNFSLDASLSSSSATGDKLSYLYFTGAYNDQETAASSNAGTWAISGSPVAPVPEPARYALLLAGLALTGYATRRRT